MVIVLVEEAPEKTTWFGHLEKIAIDRKTKKKIIDLVRWTIDCQGIIEVEQLMLLNN